MAATADPVTELADELRELSAEEQQVVATLVRRARAAAPEGEPLDVVGLVHASLQADFETALAGDYDELSRMTAPPVMKSYPDADRIPLPRELLELEHSFLQVVRARASRRDFGDQRMSLSALSTLLHYSYGIRKLTSAYNVSDFPTRFVPSAGGLQSNELYLVVNGVEDVPQGLYHYHAPTHSLETLSRGIMRRTAVGVSFLQEWMHHASVVCILTCVMERVEWKYGPRGYRMIHVDAGHLSQNLQLLATALKLRATAVSGFFDRSVDELLEIDGRRELTALMVPIGTRPAAPASLPRA
jgi:SagB-type dehydrogenase family enzyme